MRDCYLFGRPVTVLAVVDPVNGVLSGLSPQSDVVACGMVVNRAGDPLAGVSVVFGLRDGAGTPVAVTTLADGTWSIGLDSATTYAVHATDGAASTRNGVVYTTFFDSDFSPPQAPGYATSFHPGGLPAVACPGGSGLGVLLRPAHTNTAGQAIAADGILKMDAPGVGFLHVAVTDAATSARSGLGGARVATAGFTAVTDPNGLATIACRLGRAELAAQPVPLAVAFPDPSVSLHTVPGKRDVHRRRRDHRSSEHVAPARELRDRRH